MLCGNVELRLYDEDCRDSLEGRSVIPTDIRDHLRQCTDCRILWDEAVADTRALSEALALQPPDRLRARLHGAYPSRPAVTHWMDWAAATWSLVGGAVGASVVGSVPLWPASLQWVGFAVGSASVLACTAVSRLHLGRMPIWPSRLLPGSVLPRYR